MPNSTASPWNPTPPDNAESQRSHPRKPISTRVEVFETTDHAHISNGFFCETADLGRGGIGLRSKKPVLPGARIIMRLILPGGRWRLLFGVVRHVKYVSDGMHQLGVQFMPMPPDVEYQQFLARLTRQHGACEA